MGYATGYGCFRGVSHFDVVLRENLIGPVLLALLLCFSMGPAGAQDAHIITETLHSDILNETREFEVRLPEGYQQNSGKKFDVVYVLDGEDIASLVDAVVAFGNKNDLMPPLLIVGLHNRWLPESRLNSRERDFLPVHDPEFPMSGGSDRFLDFLKNELIPYINQKYPSSGHRILFGHSYGGLLTVYAALTRPEMFNSYIASDPSLWWSNGYMLHIAPARLASFPALHRSLYLGGRSGQNFRAFGLGQMETILQQQAPARLVWRTEASEDEHHGSVRLKNIYDGLKFTYFGYAPFILDFYPAGGILLPAKPVRIHMYSTYLDYMPGIRYTTDGSTPKPSSPRFDAGLLLKAPADLTLKLFATLGSDRIVAGHFRSGKVFPAVPRPLSVQSGGLHYRIYGGAWETFPRQAHLDPVAEGLAGQGFDLKQFGKEPFACVLDGYIEIREEGYYTFFFDTREDARLYVGGELLINPKAMAWNTEAKSFVVPLQKGFYPVKIEYLHRDGEPGFVLLYTKPEEGELAVNPLSIPGDVLYSESASRP